MSKRSGTGIQLTAKEADALLSLIAIAGAGAEGEGDYAGFDYRAMDRAHQKLVNARGGVESPATGTKTALTIIEGFIRDELENRKESFLPDPNEEESGYIQSAESALEAVETLRSEMMFATHAHEDIL